MRARTLGTLACGALALAGASLAAQGRPRPSATVNQLMRGLFFPASNVVFAAQGDDFAAVPRDPQGSKSTDLLKSVFGGWEAVENSALAIADAAPLLLTPGRICSNGREAPVTEASWRRYTEQTREAGLVAARAARAKDQDAVVEATDQLVAACGNCHRAYREGGRGAVPQTRCAPRPGAPSAVR